MKKIIYLPIVAIVACLLLCTACKKKEVIEEKTIENSMQEKEETLPDDLSLAEVSNISFSECLSHTTYQHKGMTNPDSLAVAFDNGTLFITHFNLMVNCEFENVDVIINSSNDTIRIKEIDTPNLANCLCEINNSFQINNVPHGRVVIVLENSFPIYCKTFDF